MYSTLGSHRYGALGRSKIVTAIYSLQCCIIARLNAIFDGNILLLRQRGEIIQLLLIDAIGSRTYYDSRNIIVRQGLVVALPQPLQRSIGVGEGLEVDQILLRLAVATTMELNTLVDLLRDALRRHAIRRCKGCIVTERTSAHRNPSIPIRAAEAGIYGHLLHSVAEHTAEICRIGVETSAIAPRINHLMLLLRLFLLSYRRIALGRAETLGKDLVEATLIYRERASRLLEYANNKYIYLAVEKMIKGSNLHIVRVIDLNKAIQSNVRHTALEFGLHIGRALAHIHNYHSLYALKEHTLLFCHLFIALYEGIGHLHHHRPQLRTISTLVIRELII